jgi:clan AA aspartic protease (TIGR02281 family)
MKHTLVTLATVFFTLSVCAQDVKRPDSYNYTRGVEALQKGNTDEALEYLNKELGENSQNGYALAWIATIRNHQNEYGRALTAVNLAIKYIPKKDKEFQSASYAIRAASYLGVEDTIKALKDYNRAIEINPTDADLYEKRADTYYYLGQYAMADKDYQKIISLDEGSVMGYMGLGRNANAEQRYDDAIKQFSYVIKLAADYSSGYSFRAESYAGLKRYNEAIDDIIKALAIDGDNKAFREMQSVADSAFAIVVTKLKVQMNKATSNNYWPYCLGIVYEYKGKQKEAIEYYKQVLNKDASSATVAYRIASCFDEIGDYTQALEYSNRTIELDSVDYDNYLQRASIENNAGMTKEAISDLSFYINKVPDSYYAYYQRGWVKENSRDIDGAIEDYTMSITLEPKYAYSYLCRGRMFLLKGKEVEANKDFQKVTELDTVPESNSCAQYAYLSLGDKIKAIEWMNAMLQKNDDSGNNYDAACLYSLMGNTTTALSYLRKAFEKGFRRFAHIQHDDDLDNIRRLPEFKVLIDEYQKRHEQEIALDHAEEAEYVEKVAEVPFINEGNLYKVKCQINNLPLHFIFDTGASDVSMSAVEATFMLKNDYLSPNDISGKQRYMTADGEISEGTVINLRKVNFGGLTLDNIKASVIKNQNAPLLLGQSILNRLGKIEIDNDKKVIKVTYKEEISK